jgi:hypothetical protein
MAIATAKVSGADDRSEGNRRRITRDLTFSGNYATGGETFTTTTANLGLRRIEEVIVHGGVAAAADVATAIPVHYNYSTSKFVFYEGSAAGTALSEKTNAEAYPTGAKCRVTIIGY